MACTYLPTKPALNQTNDPLEGLKKMNKQFRGLFLIMGVLLLSLGAACSNATVEGMATSQAESFNALQQEVTGLATTQAESRAPTHEDILGAATTQAERFSAFQEETTSANATQAELMGEMQQDIHMVATAVASQDTPSPPIETLAIGVGLLWQQAGVDDPLPVEIVAGQSIRYDNKDDFLDDWVQRGPVLFIWQQTTSTDPEDSLNEIEGNLYYASALVSENIPAAGDDDIQFIGLQNILFLTSPGSEPIVVARSYPQMIDEAQPIQQTDTFQDAFTESGIPFDQLDHLLILFEEDVAGNEQPQLTLVMLESGEVGGPDPNDPNCGQYCAQCYSGLCLSVCWVCNLFN